MTEMVGHDDPGDLPEPKDEMTTADRVAAFLADVREAGEKWGCELVPRVAFENVGESGYKWITAVSVGARAREVKP